MITFKAALVKIIEEGRLEDLLEKILERIKTAQDQLDDGEGIKLHQAQGEKRALVWVLEQPEELVRELGLEEEEEEQQRHSDYRQ